MENCTDRITQLLKEFQLKYATLKYGQYEYVIDITDPDYLIVGYLFGSSKHSRHYVVVPKTDSYVRISPYDWWSKLTVYGVKLQPLKASMGWGIGDYTKPSFEFCLINVYPSYNFKTGYRYSLGQIVADLRIRNINEVLDKLTNANFWDPMFWIEHIDDSSASSLKGIFGSEQFRLMQYINELGQHGKNSGPLYQICSIKQPAALAFMQLHDYPEVFEAIKQRVKEDGAHPSNFWCTHTAYDFAYQINHLCEYLTVPQLAKYLLFWTKRYSGSSKEHMIPVDEHHNTWNTNWYVDYLKMRNDLKSVYDIKKLPVLINNFEGPEWELRKSLGKWHNRAIKIYTDHVDAIKQNKIAAEQENYDQNVYSKAKEFEMEFDDYIIKAPVKLGELIREGRVLNHCVGSYISSVSMGKEYILFLRKKEDPDTPFYTIDVTSNRKVRQIHGNRNCNVTDDLKPLIQKWASEKNVTMFNTSGLLTALQ